MKQIESSKFKFVLSLIFLVIGVSLYYRFDFSAIWFIFSLMLLAGITLEKFEERMNFVSFLRGILIVIVLMITGIVQVISGLSVQTLFLQVSVYTTYHLTIHLIWSILWIILTILDFVSSKGIWNLVKLFKSFIRTGFELLPFAALSILVQL